MIKFDNFGGGR